MTAEHLVMLAEYYRKYSAPLPVDLQSRLLEAGIDIQQYQHV